MADFGDNLRAIRKRRGLTQQALAALLGLKTPAPVVLWEGQRKAIVPTPDTILKLSAALRCQPGELLDGVETEYDKLRANVAPTMERGATRGRENASHNSVIGVGQTPSEKISAAVTSPDSSSVVPSSFPGQHQHEDGGGHARGASTTTDRRSELQAEIEHGFTVEYRRLLQASLEKLDVASAALRAVADAVRAVAAAPTTRSARTARSGSPRKPRRQEARRKRA